MCDAGVNGDDPVVYMLRAASKRRHLTDDQRAMLALAELQWRAHNGKRERKEKLKQDAGPGRGHKREKTVADASSATVSEPKPRERQEEAREQAAESHTVPERQLRQTQRHGFEGVPIQSAAALGPGNQSFSP